MRPETLVNYDDETWQYVYVNGDSRIREGVRRRIMWNMIDMYKKGTSERRLKSQTMEGVIKIKGRRAHGDFSGTYFIMEGEFEKRRLNLGVLLLDKFDPTRN